MELVDLGVTWSNGTLRDTVDTVHRVGSELSHAMPVKGGSVVRQKVGNGNLKHVAPVCGEHRSRILSIDEHADPVTTAVPVASRVGDDEVVLDSHTSARPFGIEVSRDAVAIAPARTG